MGPFPHNAPYATISADNPAGTDGFEFVEFAHPDPQALCDLFTKMGYTHVATHREKALEVWQQGDITYLINAAPGSHAAAFADAHGPCAASMGWRVVDAQHAFDHAVARGAIPYEGDGKAMDVPAIHGIGGSLIYFIDQYRDTSPYNTEFDWVHGAYPGGVGFHYLDHLTHNVFRGNMDVWFRFYGDLFNFSEIRFSIFRANSPASIHGHSPHPAGESAFRSMRIAARQARLSPIWKNIEARASSISLLARMTFMKVWMSLLVAVSVS